MVPFILVLSVATGKVAFLRLNVLWMFFLRSIALAGKTTRVPLGSESEASVLLVDVYLIFIGCVINVTLSV